MKTLVLFLICLYQTTFSPDTGIFRSLYFVGKACRFIPSCSQYTYEAVAKYGTIKGLGLGFRRVLRCNPLNPGGIDFLK